MVEDDALEAGYREMAADSERERDAEEWCEGLMADRRVDTWAREDRRPQAQV